MKHPATSTILFTTRTLNTLTGERVPKGQKSKQFTDSKVSALKLELTPAGKKTFCFRAQKDSKKHYMHIGSYPAIGIDEARKIARELRAQLDRGIDISTNSKRQKEELTLAEFFHQHYLPYYKANGKRSLKDDIGRFKRIEPALGHITLSALTRREIESFLLSLLSKVNNLKPATRNRHMALLSAIYRFALNWELVATNPVHGIKQLKENNMRTRTLSEPEQAAFVEAADEEINQTAANLLKGLLLTGCRKSELLYARWEHLNLERGELFLPHTKNGYSRTVVLNDEALTLFTNLSSRGQSAWLFPNPRTPEKAIVNIDKAWRRIKEMMTVILGEPVKDLRIHDLRHTYASNLANDNCSLHVISKVLGHRSVAQSARYAHISNDKAKQAVSAAAVSFRNARAAAAARKAKQE